MTSVLANDMLRVIPDLNGEGEAENGKCYLDRPMTCPIFHRSWACSIESPPLNALFRQGRDVIIGIVKIYRIYRGRMTASDIFGSLH